MLANLVFIAEADDDLQHLESLALPAMARAGAIRDARIAAICLSHGVAELWSADRDFSRFPALAVRNPLIG
jgi:predicted nucleic acid-binding protein